MQQSSLLNLDPQFQAYLIMYRDKYNSLFMPRFHE